VALDQEGSSYKTIDIFRTPLGVDDLRALLGGRSPADLFSWKSPQAKLRGITPGSRTDEELLQLMSEEPRLIRRPLVRVGDDLVIGADVARIKSLVGGSS
jgi:arsenate reductase-like glutaredoxin family protein